MTIATTINRARYRGDGQAASFPAPFPFFQPDDLEVVRSPADGSGDTTLALEADYAVSGGGPDGGEVVLPAPLADGDHLTIRRVVSPVQVLDLVNLDGFDAELVEREFDRSRMLDQQIMEELSRCLKYPASSGAGSRLTEAGEYMDGVAAARDAAQAARSGAETAESGALDARQAAEAARDLAQRLASAGEDVEVLPGVYSAYHWARLTEDYTRGDAANVLYDDAASGLDAATVQQGLDRAAAGLAERYTAPETDALLAGKEDIDPAILREADIGAKVVAPQARSQAPRQAILTCPTDANGLPDFLADNAGDLEIQASASAPLALSFAEGFGQDGPLDGYLRLTAPLTVPASALTNDTRNHVFINGDGTAGVTTMRPEYGPHRAGVDRVPTMSANSQDGITLSASSVYDSNYEPYMAFNDSIGEQDRWVTQDGVSTGWLQAAFPEARRVDGYTLQCPAASKAGSMPNTWTFEGSDDGATWTELDAQTGVTWTGQEVKRFSLATPGQWRCVRINVTALNGGSVLNIGEMEILGSGDFFDLVRMEMRDSADVVVPRVYGGYCDVDSSGNITGTYSYAPGTFAVRAVNGGANIGTNQRHEEENPFGHGMPIHAVAQIKPEGDEWGHGGFIYNSGNGFGVLGQPYAGNIVVQTGDSSLNSGSKNDGNPFLNAGNESSAPCRIKVWRAF
ncbi:discoidin domain-containing protein [Desulfohalovibrio reitneri]|uniref:discoidin domain-containing protein n=1 Tax=Desulfohalovibrio reitneri TaxID=1307759 RepID=UPI0004A6BF69|nr:discoidin domain-containing protein [Desulfohalovibrio reitneri]